MHEDIDIENIEERTDLSDITSQQETNENPKQP